MFYGHQPKPVRRLLNGLLAGALLVTGAVCLLYVAYAPANADDYCRGALATDGTWIHQIVRNALWNYYNWSGRWVAHGFYAAVFPYLGITSVRYNILIALSPIIWMCFFFASINILFRDRLTTQQKAGLSLVLCAVYWVGMAAPGETWYWLTGSIEYQVPALLMILCLAVLTSNWCVARAGGRRLICMAFGTVLAVVVTGLHELVGLLLFGLLIVGIVIAATQKRRDLAGAYAAISFVVAGALAINILAPGTPTRVASAMRAGTWLGHNSLVAAINATFLDARTAPLGFLADTRLLCLALVLVTSPAFVARRPQWTGWAMPGFRSFSAWPTIVLVVGMSALHLAVFAVAFADGGAPARLIDILYAVYIVMGLALFATIPITRVSSATPFARGLNIVAGIMLPLSLITSPTVARALADAPGVVSVWRPAMDAREREVRTRVAAGERQLHLEPIPYGSTLFMWYELDHDPKDWRNICFADFYGAETVSIVAPANTR